MGVSAETGQEDGKDYTPILIPKSDAVRSRIAAATEKNALFAGLGSEQHTAVIDAMFEMQCAASPRIYAHLLSPPHPRVPPHTSSRHLPHATSSRHLPHPNLNLTRTRTPNQVAVHKANDDGDLMRMKVGETLIQTPTDPQP